MSISFCVKNFGTSRIDTYTGFWRFLCSYNPIKGYVSIGFWKLYRRPSIWAVTEHPGMNRSRDTAIWIFWKIWGYEKNFLFLHFLSLKWHLIAKQTVSLNRSGIFPISLGGCEPFFGEKSRRYVEKSKYSKKIFWTISQRHKAYVLSWDITYFCAKFQLLTPNRLRVYKRQTDRQTNRQTETHVYIYI